MDGISVSTLLDEILKTRLHAVIGVLILWVLIGAFSGVVLSVIVSRLLSRLGAFRLSWRHGIWLKIAAIVWIVGACCLFGCSIGLMEGAFRGVRMIVSESSFRAGVLAPLGSQCADGLAHVDCLLAQAQQRRNPEEPLKLSQAQESLLSRFREGKDELNVQMLLKRLDSAEDLFVQEVVREALARLRDDNTIEEGSLSESVLRRFLPSVARWGIRRKAKSELDKLGLTEGVTQFLEKLPEAAAKSGDPATITFQELALCSVDHGVVPAIVCPIRNIARAKQVGAAVLATAAIFLPVLLFWLGRYIERRSPEPPNPSVS